MVKKIKQYDVVIVGGGAAGLTSAIYATRRELKTLLISKDIGGQMVWTNEIENYPGFDFVSGPELISKMEAQAKKHGTEFVIDEVCGVAKTDNGFLVKGDRQSFMAKAVILAFGLTPRNLNVLGEKKFRGKGVAYCATCDGPLYKGKTVAVAGGGNSGFEAAEYLAKLTKKVYLVHFEEKFNAASYLVDRVKKLKNVECVCPRTIKEIKGNSRVQSVILENTDTKKTEELKIDGLFIEIGYEAKTGWLKGFVKLNKRKEIITDEKCTTSRAGIFAAGDCSDSPYKQIVISAGEGAKAALQAYDYISEKVGAVIVPDWGKKKS